MFVWSNSVQDFESYGTKAALTVQKVDFLKLPLKTVQTVHTKV